MNPLLEKLRLTIVAITHAVRMKMESPNPKPTISAMIKVYIPADADTGRSQINIVGVPDISGSTDDSLSGESAQKVYEVERDGLSAIASSLSDGDQMAVISFDSAAYTLTPLTKMNLQGREEVLAALSGLMPQGMTNYWDPLVAAFDMLRGVEGKRAIIFTTDGAFDPKYPDPSAKDPNQGNTSLCDRICAAGITLYTAGISDGMTSEQENRLRDMSGGSNFTMATTPEEMRRYFETALKRTENAAVSNSVLHFRAIGLVEKIISFDLVTRNGNRNFVQGSIKQKADGSAASAHINLSDIGPGDELQIYVEFTVNQPKFRPEIQEQENTFGQLLITGDVPGLGLTNEQLSSTHMKQWFARTTAGTTNKEVDKLWGLHAAASGMDAMSKTSNPAEQQEIMQQTAVKVKRATQIIGDDDEELSEAMADVDGLKTAAEVGGEAAAKQAGRKTVIFVDPDED